MQWQLGLQPQQHLVHHDQNGRSTGDNTNSTECHGGQDDVAVNAKAATASVHHFEILNFFSPPNALALDGSCCFGGGDSVSGGDILSQDMVTMSVPLALGNLALMTRPLLKSAQLKGPA